MIEAALVVRRTIKADVERVFDAWTQPAHLKNWWGPDPVRCTSAEIDLRPGGRYRIANQFPDGKLLWISGEFELVEPPRKLIYSWTIEPGHSERSRVTVRFEPVAGGTEVIVTHEKIATTVLRKDHETGWIGCLDRLERLFSSGGLTGP